MASCLTTLRCILPLPVLAQGAGIALALLRCYCSRLLPSAQLPAISANGSGNVSLGHPHFLGQIVPFHGSTWKTALEIQRGPCSLTMEEGASCLVQPISSVLLQATTGTILFSMLPFAHFILFVVFIPITKHFPRPGPKDLGRPLTWGCE